MYFIKRFGFLFALWLVLLDACKLEVEVTLKAEKLESDWRTLVSAMSFGLNSPTNLMKLVNIVHVEKSNL